MAHRRRRGVGIGRSSAAGFEKKAEELKSISTKSAMETVKKLELKLTDFATKHRHEIQHDPAVRQQFLEMCAPLGIDPLLSKKSFFGGMSDFYYELATKVAEVCLASKSRNGGIISIQQVRDILKARKSKFHLSEGQTTQSYSNQDIQTAISKLSPLGGGFRTVKVGAATMIVSVPTELDNDHMVLMGLAQEAGGCVSLEQVQDATSWSSERATRALDLLLGEGMAWLDVYLGQNLYWFQAYGRKAWYLRKSDTLLSRDTQQCLCRVSLS